MTDDEAAKAFVALGHELRVRMMRLLVQAGHDGINVSDLTTRVGAPPSTLAFHLSNMVNAKLVVQTKIGREVINHANFEHIAFVSEFFTKVCCLDSAQSPSAATRDSCKCS